VLTNRADLFSQIALFAGLTPEEVDLMASQAAEKHYSAGQTLFYEGDPCSGLFILAFGRIKIVKTASSGREIMLAIEAAPSSVAEVPVFDGGPFPATVVALEDVTAYHLSKQHFQQVCRQHPDVAIKMLAVVGRRLRQLVSLVENVTFGSIRQRLAKAILDFHAEAGSPAFTIPVTHEELALRLGTVREVVSRNLGRFQAEGFLRLNRRDAEILDIAALQREAETEL
jgi:CRP/FNR family cyclic AMP-dependent transcriptional regulator